MTKTSYFPVLTLWLKVMRSCYGAPSAHGGSCDELWLLWAPHLLKYTEDLSYPEDLSFVMTLIYREANNLDLKEE